MVEEGEREEDPLESFAATLLGRGAAALGWTRPATGTKQENQGYFPNHLLILISDLY